MAIAAVPEYLGKHFDTASPGLRFGMYLPLWGEHKRVDEVLWTTHDLNYRETGRDRRERQFKDENKTEALRQATALNVTDKAIMAALQQRQNETAHALESSGQLLHVEAAAVAPFSTGLGNEHPLENGFAFLNPYGLPYLAGSGVKGVLRVAACELAKSLFGGTAGWSKDAIEALFGRKGDEHETEHQRGALTFWDVIPQIREGGLRVEIMTPHQAHYLQKGDSPHESGQPNPINFLTVPPGSGFVFNIQCNRLFLKRIESPLVVQDAWKALIQAALEHAFQWLGFGAKTAIGYGAMHEDPVARAQREKEEKLALEQREQEQRARQRAAELEQMSAAKRAMAECLDAREDKNQPELPTLINAFKDGRWEGELRQQIAVELKAMLVAAHKWRESTNKKKPEKDRDYQNTLLVMAAIEGK